MSVDTSSDGPQTKGASQFNARLPQLTHTQINDLVQAYGLTKTQVIIVAVDRLARELFAESESAVGVKNGESIRFDQGSSWKGR